MLLLYFANYSFLKSAEGIRTLFLRVWLKEERPKISAMNDVN
jgi:hypothetical protein